MDKFNEEAKSKNSKNGKDASKADVFNRQGSDYFEKKMFDEALEACNNVSDTGSTGVVSL